MSEIKIFLKIFSIFFSFCRNDSFSSLELKSAIDALDDELKNIIYMKFYLGFNNKEISSATGDSEYLVRKKLAKALEDIKENLKEDE